MDADVFSNGIDALKTKDYNGAVRDFALVVENVDDHDDQYNLVQSYLGLAKVLIHDDSGLLMCRDAAGNEKTFGDVFLNAACAEWHSNQRKRAIDVMYKGLEIDSGHQQLNKAVGLLDSRKNNVINFLSRDHFLNKLLGRFFRRSIAPITVHTLLE